MEDIFLTFCEMKLDKLFEETPTSFKVFAFVLEAIILYILGLGIAHYLGYGMDVERIFLGLGWVILLQLSGFFLSRLYAVNPYTQAKENQRNFPTDPRVSQPFILATAFLASFASLSVLFIAKGYLTPQLFFIMIIGVLGMLILSLPRIREVFNGFHEVILSFLMTFFVPLLGFENIAQNAHRLILMIGLPIFALRLAAVLGYELSTYAKDIKYLIPTLLVRVGWQNGMFFHNLLILFAFLVLVLAVVFGLPLGIALPAISGLILGILQIWNVRKITEGKKPNWSGLIIGDFSLYILVVYFLAYSFWVR
ncbi:MAG: hypothetical protein ACPL3P_06250 [Anaerolineales bacterium]